VLSSSFGGTGHVDHVEQVTRLATYFVAYLGSGFANTSAMRAASAIGCLLSGNYFPLTRHFRLVLVLLSLHGIADGSIPATSATIQAGFVRVPRTSRLSLFHTESDGMSFSCPI